MAPAGPRWALIVCLAAAAAARPAGAADTAPGAPVTQAVPVAAPPILDGDVLDDPAWAAVPAVSEFWQTAPDEGQPASERTEVRLVYTADTLYVGVVCHDREPDRIVVSDSRRDSPLNDTDAFLVILDTFLDRQNGFVFGTSPAGVEYDAQITNQGEGADDGSLAGFNLNWDASWQVRTRTGAFGWSAEFALPFRSLRYGRAAEQSWGVNFQRTIRRRNERAFWAPLTRQYGIFRLASAGTVAGLRPPRQRHLSVTPYALAQASTRPALGRGTDGDAEIGGDLKYGVTPSLTLDLTVNTDFAQVEADDQQINLDRFSLFYPEKRPFFLENAAFFGVGTPNEVEMFFSRRVGIGPSGEVIPIRGGARLTGKAGGFNLGLLAMQTAPVHGVAPVHTFGVARVQRELRNRSAVGAAFVDREAGGGGAFNRTVAVDGRWGLGRHLDLTGYAARVLVPGKDGDAAAWHAGADYEDAAWHFAASFTEVGADFAPAAGFVRRRGYRRPEALVRRVHRFAPTNALRLLEIRPHVTWYGYWSPDGFQETGYLHMDNHFVWRGGWEFHTGVNVRREGLRAPFRIHPDVSVPPGSYDTKEVQLVFISDGGRPLSGNARLTAGGFFDGSRVSVVPELKARVGDTLNAGVAWERNDVSLSAGRFVTNLVRTRLSYSFSPRLYLQALLQYNDRIDNWSTNVRLGWLQTANTGIFLVVNENREADAWSPRDRSVVLKLSRTLELLD